MTDRMIVHRIRITISPVGILCGVCGRPVRWVRSEEIRDEPHVGHWAHVDPDELAASMARHPAGRSRPATPVVRAGDVGGSGSREIPTPKSETETQETNHA